MRSSRGVLRTLALLGALALVALPCRAQDDDPDDGDEALVGVTQKSVMLIGDASGALDLENADDRDRIREHANRKTVEFANAFVRDLARGDFAEEIERLVDIQGGGDARDKLLGFLEGLEEIPNPAEIEGALEPGQKAALRRIQLAWTLVQLVRYGAPGFRSTYDEGGTPGGFQDFVSEAEGDAVFLARIKAFEDEYERYVEVGRGSEPVERPDDDAAEDQLFDALKAMVSGGFANPPPDNLLRAFASSIAEAHLTRADEVWSIKASWHSFSGSSGEVQGRSDAAFMASGAQLLSWSLPRMNLGDPEGARDEIGKAYEISFEAKGWIWRAPSAAALPGSWEAPTGSGMRFQRDLAAWPDPATDPSYGSYPEFQVFEKITVKAEAQPMSVIDRSLDLAGQSPSGGPDVLTVEDVVMVHWKRLDAFPDTPRQITQVEPTVSASKPPPDPEPPSTFSVGGSGGSFP